MHHEKILVIRGGAIGDFILTIPAIAALRKKFPNAQLDILGHLHIASLAVAAGLADQVRSIEDARLAAFFAPEGTLPRELSQYFSKFTLVISYLFDPKQVFQKNFRLCSNARFIAAPHRPDEEQKIHATEIYLQPLQALGVFDADPSPRLSFGSEISECKLLALHPGSGSERKNWPEEKWVELISQLIAQTSFRLLLIGGEAEGNRLQRLSEKIPSKRFKVAQNLPLVELAHEMKRATFFIGHDSGISHLGAALDLPGLILWGKTVPEIWRPRSAKMELLCARKGLHDLKVEKVFSEFMKAFKRG